MELKLQKDTYTVAKDLAYFHLNSKYDNRNVKIRTGMFSFNAVDFDHLLKDHAAMRRRLIELGEEVDWAPPKKARARLDDHKGIPAFIRNTKKRVRLKEEDNG